MNEGKIILEKVKEMDYQEFQRWVCKCLSADHTELNVGVSGFDGRVNFPDSRKFDGTLIRIEQFGPVGEPIVSMTMDRLSFAGENTAIILAKSFTERAMDLTSKYRTQGKANIYLVTIESIMNKTSEEIFNNLKN